MTRQQLESLVWRETHPDFKGNTDGVRYVLHLVESRGTCSVPLSSLSLGELVDKLPSRERVKWGLCVWRLVQGPDGRVLGVFGRALFDEAQACRAKVLRQTGVIARLSLWAGSRPKVGDVVTTEEQTLVTAEESER